MKITKKEIQESANLFKSLQDAKVIDITDAISPIEKKILELYPLYERERILRHNNEAHIYQSQIDVLFGQIRSVEQGKTHAIEKALFDYDKFHKEYRNRFVEKLTFIYGKIEREFIFNVISADEGFFTRFYKVSTNAFSILGALKEVSQKIIYVKEAYTTLADLNEQVEVFEKGLLFNFPEKVFSIAGDIDSYQVRNFFTDPQDFDNPEYKPLVYSPEVLQAKSRLASDVLKS